MYMIHDASGACRGNAAEMAKTAQTLDEVSANLAGIYADRARQGTPASWRDAMRKETWYTAQEAVDAGLADKVGSGTAELPPGLDVAAFTSIPGRIAASLRSLPAAAAPQPQDAARHEPMTGTHSHPHPAYGSQGGDAMHSHEHSHDGDASHSHDHGGTGDHAGTRPGAAAGEGDCETCDGTGKIDEGHRTCPDCDGSGKAAAQDALTPAVIAALRAAVREELRAAAPASHGHAGQSCWDPDGDGDCDLTPEGDTDHDYWSADGKQLRSVPGKPLAASDLTEDRVLALIGEELDRRTAGAAASVDNSDWDAGKAWSAGAASDDPAAFYAGICAGRRAGDKSTQAAWALPYKYSPSSPVNAAGVRNALSRLPQTQGLTNATEAKATLQKAMKQVNPDWEPDDSADPDLSGIDLEQIRSALRGAPA
jgi:Clp protease